MNKLFLLSTAAVALFALNAKAEVSIPVQSKVKVKVIESITMTHATTDELNFGTIMASQDHVVSVDAEGARTGTAEGQLVDDAANAPKRDLFTITSPDARSVNIDVAKPDALDAGSKLVPTLKTSPALSGGKLSLNKGSNELKIYGDLDVKEGAAAGDYAPNYTVTLRY